MAKFPEASKRLYENVFICKKCKRKVRSTPQKVIQKKLSCRNCQGKNFRLAKKTKTAAKK